MRFFNRAENPNTLAGLFLLMLLAVFAGPTVFPELVANLGTVISFMEVDEGVPCTRLRTGEDRAVHQSLIGRAISDRLEPPISLDVRTGAIPTTPEGRLSVSVIVKNETIGTIPILVTDDFLITDPNNPLNGLGVVFNSTAPITNIGENVGSYPEDRIRLLGPRQICVHRVEFTQSQLPALSTFTTSGATIKAFYRNNTRGNALPVPQQTTVYSDQGLWTGVIESALETISAGSF